MNRQPPDPRPDHELATLLRDGLEEHLDAHQEAHGTPAGDLGRVQREGRRLRRAHRRRGAALAVGAVAAAAAAVAVGSAVLPGAGEDPRTEGFEPVGRLDYSEGLRAYAAPGAEIHLGGRVFPWERLDRLDTDAAATPYGVVHFPDGVPHLLREDGTTVRLEAGEAEPLEGFHPSAKADASQPWVAYAWSTPDGVVVTVRDLAAVGPTGLVVGKLPLDRCAEACDEVVVDAIDDGQVFVRIGEHTVIWDPRVEGLRPFSDDDTRVADVRAGVVLYDGEKPDGLRHDGWRLVRGSIDAQLTHDGRHVLDWSNRLEPVDPAGQPIVLQQGGRATAWFTVDTDGSVLVAELVGGSGGARSRVYDCEVPSGECAELGSLPTGQGDPMFIGNDM